jgi:hypothetical protein
MLDGISLVIRARNLGARLPRIGVGDNPDLSYKRRISAGVSFTVDFKKEVLRSQSEWRQQLARIACTEVIDDCICDSA